MAKEIIYLMSTLMDGLIKIGKIDNFENRMRLLENNGYRNITGLKREFDKDGLTISMYEYASFEQTGMIGSTITLNDSRTDVVRGDIVLYNSSQISIFHANSSLSYTKLGRINISKSELADLLVTDAVIVTMMLKKGD